MTAPVSFRITGPKIVHEAFDDEIVIINLETGTYFSVEGVAAEIWARVDGATARAIARDLADRYGVEEAEVTPPVMRFLDELQSEGLIEPGEAPETPVRTPPAAAPARTGPREFHAPLLRKFDDMQELLLLDPIHDFDDAGWPIAKPAQKPER
jgi:hypothetical protein